MHIGGFRVFPCIIFFHNSASNLSSSSTSIDEYFRKKFYQKFKVNICILKMNSWRLLWYNFLFLDFWRKSFKNSIFWIKYMYKISTVSSRHSARIAPYVTRLKLHWRRFFRTVQSYVPKFDPIFSNNELHIILKRRNLKICKHSSFLNQ